MPFETLADLTNLLSHLADAKTLTLPHRYVPGSYSNDTLEATEESWDAYVWNPPAVLAELIVPEGTENAPNYLAADTNASIKPTWEYLIANQTEYEAHYNEVRIMVRRADNAMRGLGEWAADQRTDIIRRLRVPVSVGILPGHRIERMTSLVVMAQQEESQLDTEVRLINAEGQTLTLTTRSDLRSYIRAVTTETNRLHNLTADLFETLQPHIQLMRDPRNPPRLRIQGANLVIQNVTSIQSKPLEG